ncbi:pre-mRNA-splicing factor syf1 [Coemansia biformis]|uniref:Pre-mRNA-splicing factor syf1 n=1 Tax=Coemansia biformis TaxID=1286918 RepID=A0A9W7Y794_9FUNG|nr:pre-mRNA-splicing factor syf1 [Coemansia biformis]
MGAAMEIDIGEEDLRFEEEVLQSPYKLKGWQRYIEHRREGPPRALTIVYERAVAKLPGSYKLWHQYLQHRVCQLQGKNPLRCEEEMRKTRLCFERALLVLHKMPVLWLMYARFLARQPDVTQARRCFDRALRSLPVTQHATVWAEYLRFARRAGGTTAERVFRRYLQLWPEQAEQYIDWCVERGNWRMAAAQLVKLLDDPGFKSPRATSSSYQLWRQLAQIIRHHPDMGLDVEPVLRDGISRFGDQAGELWTALANCFIARGQIERARDVFEEAVASVCTVRDFALVFDAYAEMEEASIAAAMEDEVQQTADGAGSKAEAGRRRLQLDLRLLQLERLMDRRPVLVSDIQLRQNVNDVDAWLRRADLWQERADDGARGADERTRAAALVVDTYEGAVQRVDARRTSTAELWLAYARHWADDVKKMRAVLDRATAAPMASVDDLAAVYVAYAEAELAAGDIEHARQVLTRATAEPRASGGRRVDYRDNTLAAAQRVFKSQRVWALLVDVEEATGTVDSCRAAYERMLELRIATPQVVVNYAVFLEEHQYFEDSFRAYERGIDLFGYPVAIELWNIYLRKFTVRYGGSKLERARDLFEQALNKCPPEYAKPIFVAYGRLEEEHGLARRALRVYERATAGVHARERLDMFRFYAARTAELVGAAATRAIYERGIEELGDRGALELALEYSAVELQLGEVDRARALYQYASQFADPRTDARLWTAWNEFEVTHGNEDTFREMLRVKRSVQARFNTDAHYLAALEVDGQRKRAVRAKAQADTAAAATAGAANPDEVTIDMDDEDL